MRGLFYFVGIPGFFIGGQSDILAYVMEHIILTALIVLGIIIVISIMMQPSKQQDALSALSGGASDLFQAQKSRGFESVIKRATAVMGVIWLLLGLLLMILQNR